MRYLFVSLLVLASAASVDARRREGGKRAPIKFLLPVPAIIGGARVEARSYRINISGTRVSLVDPRTMVTVAGVDAEELPPEPGISRTRVKVDIKTGFVTITIKQRKRTLSMRGIVTGKATSERSLVEDIKGKQEQAVKATEQKTASDGELVERAVKRYGRSVEHCKDLVHKKRWATDDPRFFKCVCPQLDKWRLPRLGSDLRHDVFLTKGRSGYSFTVTSAGRAKECRVWVGTKAPPYVPVTSASSGPEPTVP